MRAPLSILRILRPIPRRRASSRAGVRGRGRGRGFSSVPLVAGLLGAVFAPSGSGLATLARGQAAPAVAPGPRPAATPGATPGAPQATNALPYNEDPNVPGISRDERIRRQEALIRRKLGEGEAKKAADRLKELEDRLKEAAKNRDVVDPNSRAVPGVPGEPGPSGEAPAPGIVIDGAATPTPGPKVAAFASVGERDAEGLGYANVTFYTRPATVVARPGETFTTQARLLVLDKSSVDSLQVVVRYPPGVVEPVSIHQDGLADRIDATAEADSGPRVRIDRTRGEIRYAARLATPIRSLDTKLVEIVWRAIQPADDARIRLGGPAAGGREAWSAAWSGKKLLTQNEFGPSGGSTGVAVRILEGEGSVPRGVRLTEGGIAGYLAEVPEFRARLDAPPPVFSIDAPAPPDGLYPEGEIVAADILLDNPAGAVFDEVRLALRYDPMDLEVLDTDAGNLVHEGINILDGPFHAGWKWSEIYRNAVRPEAGLIVYRVGSRAVPESAASGVLARVFVRILRPTREPLFHWIYEDRVEGSGEATTAPYFLGENLYDRYRGTGVVARAPRGLPRESVPPPPSQAAEKADPALYR